MEVVLVVLGGFVGFVAMMIISALLRGYALSVLWGWFMVPTLGLPALSVAQAIGIAMVVSFLTHQDTSGLAEKEEGAWEKIGRAFILVIIAPLLALLFGWIVHQFM